MPSYASENHLWIIDDTCVCYHVVFLSRTNQIWKQLRSQTVPEAESQWTLFPTSSWEERASNVWKLKCIHLMELVMRNSITFSHNVLPCSRALGLCDIMGIKWRELITKTFDITEDDADIIIPALKHSRPFLNCVLRVRETRRTLPRGNAWQRCMCSRGDIKRGCGCLDRSTMRNWRDS